METEKPLRRVVYCGCVQRFMFTQAYMSFIEVIRIRHGHATHEEALREAIFHLADVHGVSHLRMPVTEEAREKIASQGLLSHANVVSMLSRSHEAKKRGRIFVEVIILFPENENFTHRLREKLQVSWNELIKLAVDAYGDKRP